MKEDYLWDKTGSDAEIEKLETALRAFRYEEAEPPVIPAKVLPFVKKEAPRKSFPFLRAIAACLALMSISLGVWILISNSETEIARDNSPENPIQNEITIPDDSNLENERVINSTPATSQTEFVESKSKPKISKIRKSNRKTSAEKTIARKVKNTGETIRLTAEEKYAYQQLMLALSITSTKLKLVKEKIDGTENQAAVLKPKNNNSGRK